MSNITAARRIIGLLIWVAILVWALYSFFMGDWGLLRAMATGGLIGIAIVVVFYIFAVKRMLLTLFSSYSHTPASPAQFPRMDVPHIERLTAEWEALGFVQRGDSEGRSSNPKIGVIFSRLFEREDAIVELVQQFTPTKALAPSSMLLSFWGEREQVEYRARSIEHSINRTPPLAMPTPAASPPQELAPDELPLWALGTHNRTSNRYYRVLTHPRVMSARLESGASPAQLWELHRKRTASVSARLGQSPMVNDLPTIVRAHGQMLTPFLVRRIQKTPAYKLAFYSLNRKPGPAITDGELAPLG